MIIFDIETDGLLDEVTKIHCLSYFNTITNKSESITDYNDIIDFIDKGHTLIGHNIIRYDIPVIEKLLDIKVNNPIIDTLGLSWYLYPDRNKHGLELWGEEFGVSKPKIEDWKNLTVEEYIFRCEEDVKINTLLFNKQYEYLKEIYSNVIPINSYINFKLECIRDQEKEGITLDINLCERTRHDLEYIIQDKVDKIAQHMPKTVLKTAPSSIYKKDGSLTVYGAAWKQELINNNLPEDSEAIYQLGNPTSPKQLKDWLFSLGWKPITFKFSKSTGKMVEQISLPFGQGLCPSIQNMFETFPILEELNGLSIAQHRFGIIKSFLENEKNGKIYSTAHGFTNTMRLTHSKPLVNLPSVSKPYGKEIRGCLTIPNDNYIMCGADISGLEDNTKQHYIAFFDPQYVKDMRVPGFDPHNDIAVLSGLMSKEDSNFYSWADKQKDLSVEDKNKFKNLKKIRNTAKVVNFSATYGAGAAKIAETAKISLNEAKTLHAIYWSRNKAVKQTAKAFKIKEVLGQKWLYNPVSGFWMFLKEDKDKFSTGNQSTGVFVFDMWLREARTLIKPYIICFQYHDELMFICLKKDQLKIESLLIQAMKIVNEKLKLNVEIGISVDWGINYAECH